MPTEATVYVIDDESDMRTLLRRLLESAGFNIETFATAKEFLDAYDPQDPGCLLLDICLPDMNGLELQAELSARRISIPVIVLTGRGDVPMAVRALKAGAVDIIEKPCHSERIVSCVREAIKLDQESRQDHIQLADLAARYECLTPREREIMRLVVGGQLNKQIAAELGISRKTIEIHRSHVMLKMQAGSLAELVQMAIALDRVVPYWRADRPKNEDVRVL